MASTGCGDTRSRAIDRETFVGTYVELREAALQTPGGRITPEKREEVLARRGVSEEDLVHFVEIHGRNVAYMSDLWNEVEARLEPDTIPGARP